MRILVATILTLLTTTAFGFSIDNHHEKTFQGGGDWSTNYEAAGTWNAVYNFNKLEEKSSVEFSSVINVEGSNFAEEMANTLNFGERQADGSFIIFSGGEAAGTGNCEKTEDLSLSCDLEALLDGAQHEWNWLLSSCGKSLTETGSMTTESDESGLRIINWTGVLALASDGNIDSDCQDGCDAGCDHQDGCDAGCDHQDGCCDTGCDHQDGCDAGCDHQDGCDTGCDDQQDGCDAGCDDQQDGCDTGCDDQQDDS